MNIHNKAGLKVKRKSGNLHVGLEGCFNRDTAEKLTSTLVEFYEGKGNIFIDTRRVTDIEPHSDHVFCSLLSGAGLPKSRIYLKGEQGLRIGRDSIKVIIARKRSHGGCGGCNNCKCQPRKGAVRKGEQLQAV